MCKWTKRIFRKSYRKLLVAPILCYVMTLTHRQRGLCEVIKLSTKQVLTCKDTDCVWQHCTRYKPDVLLARSERAVTLIIKDAHMLPTIPIKLLVYHLSRMASSASLLRLRFKTGMCPFEHPTRVTAQSKAALSGTVGFATGSYSWWKLTLSAAGVNVQSHSKCSIMAVSISAINVGVYVVRVVLDIDREYRPSFPWRIQYKNDVESSRHAL